MDPEPSIFDMHPAEALARLGLDPASLPPAVQSYIAMQHAPDPPLPDAMQHFQALSPSPPDINGAAQPPQDNG